MSPWTDPYIAPPLAALALVCVVAGDPWRRFVARRQARRREREPPGAGGERRPGQTQGPQRARAFKVTRPTKGAIMARLKIITNADGTITVRVGRAVEHVSTQYREKGEIFDAVKYAAISKGAIVSDVELTRMLQRS